jgi:predicted nucleic acid-binding protein
MIISEYQAMLSLDVKEVVSFDRDFDKAGRPLH